ncbi:hypothetical protein G9P44_002014 [Scheffersomyces stipitis]|nr:hypothetical protein G9P44_002014 [Scheffersomyces stipitis]
MSMSDFGSFTPNTTSSIPDPTTFKSTLPPRKRAKTKEEKEQRRVERILRNRRAAHASREKKRKHVEYLESYVLKLEQNLASAQSNFDTVHSLLSEHQVTQLVLQPLEDVDDLKNKIHINLSSSASRSSSTSKDEDEQDHDDEDFAEEESASTSFSPQPEQKKRRISESEADSADYAAIKNESQESQSEYQQQFEQPEIVVKREDVTESSLLQVKSDYYNYLSPVSIHSPTNSPIDLTLTKNAPALTLDNGTSTTFSSPESLSGHPSNFKIESNHSVFDNMGQNSEVILSANGYLQGFDDTVAASIRC